MGMIKKIGLPVMSVVIILFLSFMAYEDIKNFENTIVDKTQQHLLTIAKTQAAHIEDILRDIQSQLDILALNPIIKKRLKEGVRSSEVCDLEECPIEDSFKYLEDIVVALYRIDSKGIVQGRSPFKKGGEESNYSNKNGVGHILNNYTKYFEDKDAQQGYISEVFTTNSGKKAISVCVPVFEKEEFIGVLRALIHLKSINDIVNHIKAGKKGYAQIIDNDGIMIAHPKAEHLGRDILSVRKEAFPDFNWVELENILSRITRGEEGVGTYHSAWWRDEKPHIVKKLTAFSPINLGNELWSINITMGYDEISTPIIAQAKNILITGGILFIILIVVTAVFIKNQKEKTMLAAKAQSLEEIRKLNDHLDHIIESSLDCIMVSDKTGYITRVNKYFLKLFGYSEEEVLGKHMMEITPMNKEGSYESTTGELIQLGKEYTDNANAIVSKFLEEGKATNWENYYFNKDGKLIPIEQNIVCLYDKEGERTGAVAIVRDITERKKFEEELKMSEEKYRSLIDNANDAVISIDEDFNILEFNKKAVVMFGYSRDEVLGKSILVLTAPGEREKSIRQIEAFNKDHKLRVSGTTLEREYLRKDGSIFLTESSS